MSFLMLFRGPGGLDGALQESSSSLSLKTIEWLLEQNQAVLAKHVTLCCFKSGSTYPGTRISGRKMKISHTWFIHNPCGTMAVYSFGQMQEPDITVPYCSLSAHKGNVEKRTDCVRIFFSIAPMSCDLVTTNQCCILLLLFLLDLTFSIFMLIFYLIGIFHVTWHISLCVWECVCACIIMSETAFFYSSHFYTMSLHMNKNGGKRLGLFD